MAVSNARIGIGGGGRETIALASAAFGLAYHCRGALPGARTVGMRIVSTRASLEVDDPLGVAGRVRRSSPFRPKSSFFARVLGERGGFGRAFTVVEDVVESMDMLERDLVRVRGACSSPTLDGPSTTSGDVGGYEETVEIGEETSATDSDLGVNELGLLKDDGPEKCVGSKFIHTSSSVSWGEPRASGGNVGGNSLPLPFPGTPPAMEDDGVVSNDSIEENISANDGELKGW